MAMDSSVENNMYINKVWVQCENESCLKWRLLSNEDKAKVNHNEPWYCFMNTDSKYNKCSVSEEDFPEESQLHQSGYKIVYSQLPLGSLVLVKLKNWPSWPGILCPDPFKGKYVTYDLDGDVEQYHVEFLGDPHSRAWIDAAFAGHYSITLKPEKCKKHKWYKSALQEAYLLYGCSHEQRLEGCYLSKQDKSKAAGKVTVVAKKRVQISKNNTEKKNPKFRKRKRKAVLKSSFENVCSDDALSKENMVWLSGKESACQCRRHELDPWVRKIPWSRKWQLTPVFLPGISHGQRRRTGCSPWGHKESDMTDHTCSHSHTQHC
ncbi:zinc finger CW-type PWWP domain protein 2 isoform X2 [Bubalus kerabau]|uniref:zinc finger CW-type PWWP domain protein 2 isoform X2 n=1 Tax=Bubalus carabanensis TaxID=3119969 RepID=UPI00244EF7F6|nr:zinc finger CW-type PWWP domain protein 2 isoform X2 [Bubalus carabanensis]